MTHASISLSLNSILKTLSKRRPIFHSEADFQHELAWEIRLQKPNAEIRLEYPIPGPTRGAVDLIVKLDSCYHAIELKYLPAPCVWHTKDEIFTMKKRDAHDIGRYNVCKDIMRVEALCADPAWTGSVIVITNDHRYWTGRNSSNTIAAEFCVAEGRRMAGAMNWGKHTGGTKRGREASINLKGVYDIRWAEYSTIDTLAGNFRYLHIPVDVQAGLSA